MMTTPDFHAVRSALHRPLEEVAELYGIPVETEGEALRVPAGEFRIREHFSSFSTVAAADGVECATGAFGMEILTPVASREKADSLAGEILSRFSRSRGPLKGDRCEVFPLSLTRSEAFPEGRWLVFRLEVRFRAWGSD